MPGFPRDLAVFDPWDASLERSRSRRARAGRNRRRSASAPSLRFASSAPAADLFGLGSLLGSDLRADRRDLAAGEVWELSIGRSRARRRAAELRFVPASSRAKRISLGALAALSVGPTAGLAEGSAVAATSSEPPTTTEHSISLSSESSGRQVEMLQEALGIGADGIYGPETETAVRHFQASRGLTVDGIVGPATIAALRSHAAKASSAGVRRDAVAFTPSGEGSSGDAVSRLQSALHLPTDGTLGPETEAAIRRLQSRHGLSVDGVVGPATWSVVGISGEETLTPPASAMSHAHHSAKTADVANTEESAEGGEASGAGDTVSRLQSALHLQADGTFGPETEAAVRRLQARHGLSVDGVVGPATWSVLGIDSQSTLKPPHSALSSSSSSSSAGSGVVARVIAAGDEIATRPYVYGGGHGSFQSAGYDCSGSVSYALHGGGLLSSPEDSSALESYGEAGPGRHITIYANAGHAFMVIDGKRFDTSAQDEAGSRWSSSAASTSGYVVRHPAGL